MGGGEGRSGQVEERRGVDGWVEGRGGEEWMYEGEGRVKAWER